MATQTDFMAAVNQIAAERNINPDEVLEAIKSAIKTGFRRDYPEEEGSTLEVDINPEGGSIAVYADKKVVDDVTDPTTQISLAEAQEIEEKLRVGDHVQVDITPTGDFGRVAAQAARQVILQKIRESEKESIMDEFKDKIGDIDFGVVQRMDGDSVIFEIRRALAVMPLEDRVPNEFYKSGARLKVLLKEIGMTPKGKQLIVSRSAPDFLVGLFKLEVPEIVSGSVEIKSIAREAGSRSKVAVHSTVDGVDPIGSCVGQKGVRINAIMNELKFGVQEEKIDIISWDEDEVTFIQNALSPAQVLTVELVDEEEKIAKVVVPDDQLSLAIGKEGQNVRLAAKLTGWSIDIEGETIKVDDPHSKAQSDDASDDDDSDDDETTNEVEASEEVSADDITSLELATRTETALRDAGIDSVAKLKEAIDAGEKIKGVGPKALEEINEKL